MLREKTHRELSPNAADFLTFTDPFSLFWFIVLCILATWTSETFGETRTSSGTNLFGSFSCVGSFWKPVSGPIQLAKSESVAVRRTGRRLILWLCASCSMTIQIGGVLANQRGVWEGLK